MEKAVIFDLDGTILDTVLDIAENLNIMLQRYGYKQLSIDQVKKIIGSGAKRLVQDAIGTPISEEALAERLNYYNGIYTESDSVKTAVFDGMKQVLKELKNRGYKLAILTNKPQETTDKVYERYLKDIGFDKVIGQSNNVKCKPDKTTTLKILTELSVLPQNAYFIGDGETDVLTSINAGTNGIAVLWGYRSREDLAKAGATVFANSPLELLDLIH